MNLWRDHDNRVHVFGDWTWINIIAWSIVYLLVVAVCGLVAWAIT